MSDTPKTDANKYPADTFCGSGSKTPVVHVDFARKLERECGNWRQAATKAVTDRDANKAISDSLAKQLADLERERDQYRRNLELVAEDCEAWLNSENDEPSAEFIKLVSKYAREAIK